MSVNERLHERHNDKDLGMISPDLMEELDDYLNERGGDLQTIVSILENYADEQKLRAEFYESECKKLQRSLDGYNRVHEHFEEILEELTNSYKDVSNDCQYFKEKNKTLWQTIEELENNCENYLKKLNSLEEAQPCYHDDKQSPSRHESDQEVIYLKAFAEETLRNLDLEKKHRHNVEQKLQIALDECADLNKQLLWLEHRLKTYEVNTMQYRTNQKSKWTSVVTLNDLPLATEFHENVDAVADNLIPPETIENYEVLFKQKSPSKNCSKCNRKNNKNNKSTQNSPFKTTYREMFAEIFRKLKDSHNEPRPSHLEHNINNCMV